MSVDDDTLLAIVAVCLKKRENDEKKKRTKRLWAKEYCRQKRTEFTYQDLLEELKLTVKNDFRHFFISDASIYEELLSMIGPLIKKKDTLMREAIPVGLRLSTTLRYLATGSHFEYMKHNCGMSPISISKIVLETCEAIISRLKNYIKPPDTQDAWSSVVHAFKEKWNFPNCLGAVSGKHIAIIRPTGTDSLYYNYRKFFSIVLLAVVNADYEFLVADVDISGSISGDESFTHTPFAMKAFGDVLDIQNPDILPRRPAELSYVFVGNDGFQLSEHFLKPFPEYGLKKDKEIYNYRISRVHQIIDNTFGALCSQFGVLQKPFNVSPEKAKTIVLACCYLYNFLKRKTDPNLWDDIFDQDFEDGTVTTGSWRDVPELTPLQNPMSINVSSKAEKIRDTFVQYFKNER